MLFYVAEELLDRFLKRVYCVCGNINAVTYRLYSVVTVAEPIVDLFCMRTVCTADKNSVFILRKRFAAFYKIVLYVKAFA